MKALKLSIAALITFVVCSTGLYFLDRNLFQWNLRCWQYASTRLSCITGGEFDFETDVFGSRYQGNTRNFIDRSIFFYGAYEKPVLFFLRDAMTSVYANQGVFLDIGANTGQHSLFMSRYSKEIHAFEPWAPVLQRFQRMVEINHIKNITIHAFGLGDENSKKPFFKPPEGNLGMGSFVEGFKKENSPMGELEIQVGDDALEKAGVTSVALIKMDIEGYEKLALKGLRRTLQRHRPIVEFELTIDPKSPASIKSPAELAGLFPENYEFLVFSEEDDASTGHYALESIEKILRFDKADQFDMVAYPIEIKKTLPVRGSQP